MRTGKERHRSRGASPSFRFVLLHLRAVSVPLVCLLLASAGCGKGKSWITGTRHEAGKVVTPVLRPLPAGFTGDHADLLIADAALGCSYDTSHTEARIQWSFYQDDYMAYLSRLITGTKPSGNANYYPAKAACYASASGNTLCLDITPFLGNSADGSSYVQKTVLPDV